MDQVDWAGVQVNVSLGSWHLGSVGVTTEVSVHPLGSVEHRTKNGKFNKRPDSLSNQSRNDDSTNFTVPVHTEITLSSDHEDRRKRTNTTVKVIEVGVVEHKKDSSINKLTNENGDHSQVSLCSHRLQAEATDHRNEHDLKDEVNSDDDTRHSRGDECNRCLVIEDLRTGCDKLTIGGWVLNLLSISTQIFELSSTEAVELRSNVTALLFSTSLVVIIPFVGCESLNLLVRVHLV